MVYDLLNFLTLCNCYLFQYNCTESAYLAGAKGRNEIDGAYYLCTEKKHWPFPPAETSGDRCLVYSFGIDWDFKFDDLVATKMGCEVHAFDPCKYFVSNLSRIKISVK